MLTILSRSSGCASVVVQHSLHGGSPAAAPPALSPLLQSFPLPPAAAQRSHHCNACRPATGMAAQPGSPGAAPLLLDGGIGHLLKAKGVETLVPGLAYDQLFLAGALANDLAPDAVQEVHAAFIAAGGRGGAACMQPAACRSCRQRGAAPSARCLRACGAAPWCPLSSQTGHPCRLLSTLSLAPCRRGRDHDQHLCLHRMVAGTDWQGSPAGGARPGLAGGPYAGSCLPAHGMPGKLASALAPVGRSGGRMHRSPAMPARGR